MFDRQIELAWLAGLFDGEGCISFGNGKARPHSIRLRIVLESRDKFVIERVQEIAECGRVSHRNPQASWKPNCSDQWEWDSFRSLENHRLLKELLPYLVLKRERAVKAIAWLEMYSTKVRV